jgi:hypothetical protein
MALSIFLWGVVLAGAGGCASSARDIGSAAAPAVVRAGLHEANTADSQREIQKMLDSPAIQRVGERVGEGVGIGLFNQVNKLSSGDAAVPSDGAAVSDAASGNPSSATVGGGAAGAATEAATGARATTSTSQPIAGKTPGAAAVMGLAGGGGLNGFVHSSVQEAFLAATDPQFKAGERAMAEAIGEGFVEGMITVLNKDGPALGDTLRRQVGPIMQDLIRDQIAPAVRDVLRDQVAPLALQVWKEGATETLKLTVRPDLQPDVMLNAKNASIGASRGTHEAMIEAGILTSSGDFSSGIVFYFRTAAAIAVLIVVALLSLLLMLNLLVLYHRRNRHKSAGPGA